MKKLIVCSASVLLFIGVITVSLQEHQPAATDNLAARNAAALASMEPVYFDDVREVSGGWACYGTGKEKCGPSEHGSGTR